MDFGVREHNLNDLPSSSCACRAVQAHKGITKALLVSGDLVTYSSSDIDQLGVLANLQALVNLSTDISE